MDKKYLDEVRYSWLDDPRHLKIDDSIPAARCFICARMFLHAQNAISLCRSCDEAMSICKDGPRHDYSSFLNAKNALANRDLREPLDFSFEEQLAKAPKTNFVTAKGLPVFTTTGNEEEDERIRKLYSLD